MKKLWHILIGIILTVSLSSCAYQLHPEYVDFKKNELPSFYTESPIAIKIPGQTHKLVSIPDISGVYWGIYTVDFDAVNERAAERIGNALIRNSIPITNEAQKSLRFTTEKIYGDGGSDNIIHLEFELETGSGYKKTYDVSGFSIKSLDLALGDAITKAAVKVLQDSYVIKYIQNNGGVEKENN